MHWAQKRNLLSSRIPSTMSDKPRILFVLPSYSLGGTTTALLSLLNSDFAQRYRIDTFAIVRGIDEHSILRKHTIGSNSLSNAYYGNYTFMGRIDKIRYGYIKMLKKIPQINRWLEKRIIKKTVNSIEKRYNYDFVVAFQEGRATHWASAFKCLNKIAWIHCDYKRAYGEKANERHLYSMFSKIVCVSDFTRSTFLSIYPSLSSRTVSIHNLFDANNVLQRSKESMANEPRFDTSYFTIISLGRVCDVKRFYLIPQIVSKLKDYGLHVKWYILGNISEEKEFVKLQDAIKQYSVSNELIYLGAKSNPYPYLSASDLLISVSSSEACPMIFNEAQILGVPVLTADFGSALEFIKEGENGYISSIDRMPERIYELVSQPELLELVRKRHYEDPNASILTQLYNLFS